jgi:hypothetical protein
MRSPRPLTPEQFAMVLAVLRFNHDYYQRQGMSRAHMWPEEVANEIQNALKHGRAPSGFSLTEKPEGSPEKGEG